MKQSPRFAVLGRPISHSRSPAIHTEAMRLVGIDGTYEAVETDKPAFDDMVLGLRSGEWDGFNVTMPLKEMAARACDSLTPEAKAAGSVNTLRRSGNLIEGHSTDTVAFESIFQSGTFGTGSTVLILGSGGSARAALAATGDRTCYVSARSPVKAEALASEFGCSSVSWGTPVVDAVIVNATPIGMLGESLENTVLDTCRGLIDLPYGSAETPGAGRIRSRLLPLVDGYEFLARQAVESFLWWTGIPVGLDPLVVVARNA